MLYTDVTDVALEWAEKNVKNNPLISELIEIRRVNMENPASSSEELNDEPGKCGQCTNVDFDNGKAVIIGPSPPSHLQMHSGIGKSYGGPPILVGVVKDGEKFDFCMCNPPFFETIEESGLNPKTSCGGTMQEMVCPGGETAFITRIIEDSVQLRQSFRYAIILRILFIALCVRELYHESSIEESLYFLTPCLPGGTPQWLEEKLT